MDDVIIGDPANLVFGIATLRDIVDALFAAEPEDAAAGPLNGCKVRLFKNDVTPTKDSVLGDFTVPATTGLVTAVAPTMGVAFENGDGAAIAIGSPAQFVASADPEEPETIYGIVLTDAAGTGFLAAERFAEPVVIDHAGQGLSYLLRFAQPRL